MAAVDLPTAANDSFDDLHTHWLANTLKSALVAFYTPLLVTFPQQQQGAHPCSNWLVLIAALASEMPNTNVAYQDLITAADFMYRMCWITQQLGNVQTQITGAQATAVLTQYNAHIA